MHSVIQKILQAETEAKRRAETAKLDAEETLSIARQQAQELLAQARNDLRAEAERLLQAATQDAEREKQEHLARVAYEIKTQIRLDEATIRDAVEGVIRCVCGQRGAPQPPPQ
jgi:vacuolar-type H+-ATPase subunit H